MANARNSSRKTTNPAAHPDPITKSPESHPVGAGVGAAAGGAVGAVATGAIAGSFLGPVGTAVGAIFGGVAGGLIGKEMAEEVNPSESDHYNDDAVELAGARTRTPAQSRSSLGAGRDWQAPGDVSESRVDINTGSIDASTGQSATRAGEDVVLPPIEVASGALRSDKPEVTYQMIAEAAYYIHLSGYGGSQDDNWFRAEREVYGR